MHVHLPEHYIVIDSRIKDVGHLLQEEDTKVLALVGMGGIGNVNMVSLFKAFRVCFVLYSCVDKGVLKLNKCFQVVRLCALSGGWSPPATLVDSMISPSGICALVVADARYAGCVSEVHNSTSERCYFCE